MSKREHRRFTAEQKLEILREADQPGVNPAQAHGAGVLSLKRVAVTEFPYQGAWAIGADDQVE